MIHWRGGPSLSVHERQPYCDNHGCVPVVVINPEDEAQVDALTKALVEACYVDGNVTVSDNGIHPDTIQRALRSLIAPPRAEVPKRGWGRNATVRDRAGNEWRYRGEWDLSWVSLSVFGACTWADLDVAPEGILWAGAYDEPQA